MVGRRHWPTVPPPGGTEGGGGAATVRGGAARVYVRRRRWVAEGYLVDANTGYMIAAAIAVGGHLSGAIWYTRRQRVHFEVDVDKKLTRARAEISASAASAVEEKLAPIVAKVGALPTAEGLELKLNDTRERTVAAIQGWWGARVKAFEEEAEKRGVTPESLAEMEELEGALGKKGARVFGVLERRMHRHREERRARSGGADAPQATSGAPANGSSPAVKPEVIAALERAGFVRQEVAQHETPEPS